MPPTPTSPATDVILAARARLTRYAADRGARPGDTPDTLAERRRADAFAEARAICRGCGGTHAEVMEAITPTAGDVAAEVGRRREAARQRLAEKRLLPEGEDSAPQRTLSDAEEEGGEA